jgi:hypothetical protein
MVDRPATAPGTRNRARMLLLHTVAKYGHLLEYYQAAGFEITHHGPRPKGDDGHPRAFLRKWLVANRETTA